MASDRRSQVGRLLVFVGLASTLVGLAIVPATTGESGYLASFAAGAGLMISGILLRAIGGKMDRTLPAPEPPSLPDMRPSRRWWRRNPRTRPRRTRG